MGDSCCRIEKLQNGYEVEIYDAAIAKANDTKNAKGAYPPYKSPWVSYVFTDVVEVLKFLKTALPKATKDEFSSSFDEMATMPMDD